MRAHKEKVGGVWERLVGGISREREGELQLPQRLFRRNLTGGGNTYKGELMEVQRRKEGEAERLALNRKTPSEERAGERKHGLRERTF